MPCARLVERVAKGSQETPHPTPAGKKQAARAAQKAALGITSEAEQHVGEEGRHTEGGCGAICCRARSC